MTLTQQMRDNAAAAAGEASKRHRHQPAQFDAAAALERFAAIRAEVYGTTDTLEREP